MSKESWYLAVCKPRQDARAVTNLQNQKIRVCAPRVLVKKHQRGKVVLLDEPLFPGYVFINLSPDAPQWSKVRSTFGIRDWVRFGGQPAKVPSALVESLLGDAAPCQERKVIDTTFSRGQKVKITEGPFQGLEAVYQCEKGEMRSMVLIEFLGKNSRICVENRQLSAAESRLS